MIRLCCAIALFLSVRGLYAADPEVVFDHPPDEARPEQEPPDCEWLPGDEGYGFFLKRFPDWFMKKQPRPSPGRYCFTTWNYFTRTSPLEPSGLEGPIAIKAEKESGL